MNKSMFVGTVIAAVIAVVIPFVASPADSASAADKTVQPVTSASSSAPKAGASAIAASKCTTAIVGTLKTAPGTVRPSGVSGTTTADLAEFAEAFNQTRIDHCLKPISLSNFRYDYCMQKRLVWMAEDPSTNPASAWGHIGSKRSDGVKSVGCDGNLAGGSGNTATTAAAKWWTSSSHRASLYRPSYAKSLAKVCIAFAITHGGVPNESSSFTRAAAKWVTC